MANVVAILEDDSSRITAMRGCLTETLPGIDSLFFENAQEMIDWLRNNAASVVLISLDHDLPLRIYGGQTVDCGTGRQVADYLASTPPTCPVIVHSSNDLCASGMFFILKDGGWPCSRVHPCDDTDWIATSWRNQVRGYAIDGWFNLL